MITTRLKAILGSYDVSRYILSSADIKAVNEAIWTLQGQVCYVYMLIKRLKAHADVFV